MAVDLTGCKSTPLLEIHREEGGRIVPFAGWAMPVQYSGLMKEHKAVREGVGLFDVSHMGEFLVEGPGAEAFLNGIGTNDVSALKDGQAHYSIACNETGGIQDDLLIYKRAPETYLVCVNAGRLDEDWAWFSSHHDEARDNCTLVNASDDFAQLAVQGRLAEEVVQPLTEADLSSMVRNDLVETQVAGIDTILARTGYTGEDGFELFFGATHAEAMWRAVRAAGEAHGMVPVGLGARDTLRLEAKLALYGNDIDETTSPWEAKLGWTVKMAKGDFIGRAALAAQRKNGVPRGLVGFVVKDRGIARHGAPVYLDGELVGEVTSGTMSPSLGTAIGLCYLPRAWAKVGTEFEIEVRGRRLTAEVCKTPFYKRPY
ncbi:MAG: glycine cleavage system aminomethyltransferase GcvT [Proteobacteria bacterium]|nr:glycine cleavage system aminomethyltransferase GcvT [Pseudomonadota bacterium]